MTSVTEIRGVGNTSADQLAEIGVETINELANASLEELKNAGVRNAETILERAQARGVPIESGEEVEEEQENARYISTGIQDLDYILDGGLQGEYLIGVSGEPKAGKTQFVLQMLASAADFHDDPCVYIETEPKRFQIDRVKSLCRKDDSYKQIHRIQAHSDQNREDVDNVELQREAYDTIRENLDSVSLIVLDSFQANFRLSGKYQDRSDLPQRNTDIGEHLKALQSLANHFNCPILMTLQVMGNPDQFSGSSHDIWGPVLMDHTIAHLIHISHGKGQLRDIELLAHPGLPDDSVTVKMPEWSPIEST